MVRTTLELRAGEPCVRVRCELDNRCRDHRLRAHFPLPVPVKGSDAECAFAVVRRGLEAEGGPQEPGLPTFPSRRFVDCSDGERGLGIVHDGLLEYEVVDGGAELALTLMRCVGYLSRLAPPLRPNPAGPAIPVGGAQLLGAQCFDYAVVLHRGDWREARLHDLANDVLVPLEATVTAGASGTIEPTGSSLQVRGAEVSACHREAGRLVLRLFNPGSSPVTAQVRGPGAEAARGRIVDLRGRGEESFAGAVELGPHAIRTLVLDD